MASDRNNSIALVVFGVLCPDLFYFLETRNLRNMSKSSKCLRALMLLKTQKKTMRKLLEHVHAINIRRRYALTKCPIGSRVYSVGMGDCIFARLSKRYIYLHFHLHGKLRVPLLKIISFREGPPVWRTKEACEFTINISASFKHKPCKNWYSNHSVGSTHPRPQEPCTICSWPARLIL